jgi:hypothetical protein
MGFCELSVKLKYPISGLDKPLGLQQIEASKISRQLAQEGGKVVSPPHQPPSPPGDIAGPHFFLEAESTPEPYCMCED